MYADTTFVSRRGQVCRSPLREQASPIPAQRAVVCVSGTNALHKGMLGRQVSDDEVNSGSYFYYRHL